jgi:hypothetical protein
LFDSNQPVDLSSLIGSSESQPALSAAWIGEGRLIAGNRGSGSLTVWDDAESAVGLDNAAVADLASMPASGGLAAGLSSGSTWNNVGTAFLGGPGAGSAKSTSPDGTQVSAQTKTPPVNAGAGTVSASDDSSTPAATQTATSAGGQSTSTIPDSATMAGGSSTVGGSSGSALSAATSGATGTAGSGGTVSGPDNSNSAARANADRAVRAQVIDPTNNNGDFSLDPRKLLSLDLGGPSTPRGPDSQLDVSGNGPDGGDGNTPPTQPSSGSPTVTTPDFSNPTVQSNQIQQDFQQSEPGTNGSFAAAVKSNVAIATPELGSLWLLASALIVLSIAAWKKHSKRGRKAA